MDILLCDNYCQGFERGGSRCPSCFIQVITYQYYTAIIRTRLGDMKRADSRQLVAMKAGARGKRPTHPRPPPKYLPTVDPTPLPCLAVVRTLDPPPLILMRLDPPSSCGRRSTLHLFDPNWVGAWNGGAAVEQFYEGVETRVVQITSVGVQNSDTHITLHLRLNLGRRFG
eukprot:scaffold14637_cov141-Skeletonema_marinoi.AAC.1